MCLVLRETLPKAFKAETRSRRLHRHASLRTKLLRCVSCHLLPQLINGPLAAKPPEPQLMTSFFGSSGGRAPESSA